MLSRCTNRDSRDPANACSQPAPGMLHAWGNRNGYRGSGVPPLRGGLAIWAAKRVADYIEANIDSSLRAADLAAIAGLGESHFSRAFRNSFGMTPLTFVTSQRVRHAQNLMRGSRKPLSQIALECGMYDQAHFTRVFRKVVGINPGIWRRQFRPSGDRGRRSWTTAGGLTTIPD
jgi:AraC-like DNA-binding protein